MGTESVEFEMINGAVVGTEKVEITPETEELDRATILEDVSGVFQLLGVGPV